MTDNMPDAGENGHSVFISFSSRDRRTAKLVCKELERRGLSCWIASRDVQPGENYQSAIARAIKSAKVVVLLFTSSANGSEEIKKEISLASRFKSAVIPVRVEDVSMDEAFSYELATRQWVDAYKGWEAALENLAQSAHAYIRMRGGETGQVELPSSPMLRDADLQAISARRPTAINPARLRELEQLSTPKDRPPERLILAPGPEPEAISSETEDKVRAALAAYLGPIARMVVKKHAADARSHSDLVEKVATEIASPEAREAFKRACASLSTIPKS